MLHFLKYPVLLALPFTLAACGQTTADCSSPEVAEVIGTNILAQVTQFVARESQPLIGGIRPKPGELENVLQEFKPALANVITTSKEDALNKRFCQANMTFEFSEAIYEKANAGARLPSIANLDISAGLAPDLATAVLKSGAQLTSTSISAPITYSVQATDDGASFYTEFLPNPGFSMSVYRIVVGAIAQQQAAAKAHQDIARSMKQAADQINVKTAKAESVDSCLDRRIAEFRQIEGEEAPIRHDVLSEWEDECKAQ